MQRRLFIPFPRQRPIGGPTTFMGNLQRYLKAYGIKIARTTLFAKGIFFPVSYDLKTIKRIKSRGGRVIQRLDGVYYPSQHGSSYAVMNETIEDIYLHYADHVVFQSDYSRRQCFAIMGEKPAATYTIIHNGTDRSVLFPAAEPPAWGGPVRFVMSGSFRKPAMIEPVIKALDELQAELDFRLTVVGPFLDDRLKHWLDRPYVEWVGSKSSPELAAILRSSHVFLHSQLNDNCPNAVIEAVSCGLPVVGFDGGAMSELLPFGRELLAYVSDDLIQKYEDFDHRRLTEKISLAVAEYPRFKESALENASRYDFNDCGRRYVEVFDRVCGCK
jgi:glycosyltransferase involved in cell wall biosynthesis